MSFGTIHFLIEPTISGVLAKEDWKNLFSKEIKRTQSISIPEFHEIAPYNRKIGRALVTKLVPKGFSKKYRSQLRKHGRVMLVNYGPAYDNDKWYSQIKLHREDGPAVICSNGKKIWYF